MMVFIKKYLLSIIVIFSFYSCSDDLNQIFDQTYILKGTVKGSTSGLPVGDVIVGITNPEAPDSVIFEDDTLTDSAGYAFLATGKTDATGYFSLEFFLGMRDTSLYKYLFAYKPGYKLWRYDNSLHNVKYISRFVDETEIRLESN